MGAWIGGRSSNVEICISSEVACEGYAKVANRDGVLIKQHWHLEREGYCRSRREENTQSRSNHDHSCTGDWRPSYRYRPLLRPPADSVGRSETDDRSDGRARRDTMLLSLIQRALFPCPILRLTHERRRSISCATGRTASWQLGLHVVSRSTSLPSLVLRTRYVGSRVRDPTAEQISHTAVHTQDDRRGWQARETPEASPGGLYPTY